MPVWWPSWITPLLLVHLALAVLALEAVLLCLRRRPPGRWLPNLAAGLFLMLAVREAALGARMPWLALWLAAAGVAHVLDVAGRLKRPADGP